MHNIDAALARLGANSAPEERLEAIWSAYEVATGERLSRPPSSGERQAVHRWLRRVRASPGGPALMVRGDRVWSAVSLSPREKASVIAQSLCGACEIVSTDDGRMPLNVTFPVNVDPWSGQSTKERGSLKKAVNEELVRGGHIQPWNGAVCVTIVSLVPRSNVGRKDSDNLVKGLLDAMEGIVYAIASADSEPLPPDGRF